MGANIPGKKREQLNYLGGIENYDIECRKALEDLEGFDVVYYAGNTQKGTQQGQQLDHRSRL